MTYNKQLVNNIREIFYSKLQEKTNWGRNDVKTLLDNSISEADRGYWFREYKLGYKAGVNDMDISLQEPWNHSEAFMLGYKEGVNARQRT